MLTIIATETLTSVTETSNNFPSFRVPNYCFLCIKGLREINGDPIETTEKIIERGQKIIVMDSIVHLENVSKFFEGRTNPAVLKLRMHYAEISRNMKSLKQALKAPASCPRCGIARTGTEKKLRILPGKTPPKRMENLIKRFHSVDSGLPRQLASLMRKCQRNRSNRLLNRCSFCSVTEKIDLNKPKRRRVHKTKLVISPEITFSAKKKKKRSRDRSAGLNLSDFQTPKRKQSDNVKNDEHKTPVLYQDKNRLTKRKTLTPLKSNKLNLSRLKGIIDTNLTPCKKSKLHAFLQEL